MFEALEHETTSEERKLRALEILGAVIACSVIGGTVFWFFTYFSEY